MVKRWRCIRFPALLAVLTVWTVGSGLAAEPDWQTFAGRWEAKELSADNPSHLEAIGKEHASLRIEVDDERLKIRASAYADTGGESLRFLPKVAEVTFIASDRPAVLVPIDQKSKLLGGLVLDPEIRDPLQSETLRWARVHDDELSVYSLMIEESGRYVLQRYRWTHENGALAYVFEQFQHGEMPVRIRGRLEKQGG